MVVGLQFVKKPQQLISAGFDSKIFIWQQDAKQKWKIIQQLTDHTEEINFLKLSFEQKLLISGSADKQTFFYQFQNSQWVKCQSITCPQPIMTLDINQQCNTLLACGQIDTILIYQKDEKNNNEWKQKQMIQLQLIGFRVDFKDENQFIFIPASGEHIYIYYLNKQKDEFYLLKKIQVKQNMSDCQFFPIQSVESKNSFIVKYCENFIIFRKIGQSDFLIDQIIHFHSSFLYGSLNSDGSYLITWDGKSEEIQIRKMFETDYKEK